MKIFSRKTVDVVKKPITRLFNGGFEKMGAIKRTPDTRTKEELVQTIDAYASQIPELKAFSKEIKGLNPKHMGTIADTIELSNYTELLPTNINLNNVNGVNVRNILIKDMIEASKTNPKALELVDSIINNTDSTTSKYALASMSKGILKNKELAGHMAETAKVIPDIAKETLQGGYTMDFSKQENFMNFVKTMVNPQTKPDKITALFKELIPFADSRPERFEVDVNKFLTSGASVEKMSENYKVLPDVLKGLGDKVKDFNLVDFITKNTNLY